MEKQVLIELISRFRAGTITDSELDILKQFMSENKEEPLLIEALEALATREATVEMAPERKDKVYSEIMKARDTVKKTTTFWTKRHIAIVALTAAALLLAVFNFWIDVEETDQMVSAPASVQSNKISPGSAKAKLVLDNGTTLNLEMLSNDTTLLLDGYQIHKNANGELSYVLSANAALNKEVYNTIIIPKGGEYKLNLPDGSTIWVNSASKLRYPLRFKKSKREVELEGEAYFEIVKLKDENRSVPFFVYTGQQTLEVLGTSFNVNSYAKAIHTTLVEGKVKLSYPNTESHYLNPNQQAAYTPDGTAVRIKEVDPFYFVAWKSGSFAFENASITNVMEVLGRWYEADIHYQADVHNVKFSGKISKYEEIEKVLKLIEITGAVKFKIEGRRIIVMK